MTKIHFVCVVVCQAQEAEQSWSFMFSVFVCIADGAASIRNIILGEIFIPVSQEYRF